MEWFLKSRYLRYLDLSLSKYPVINLKIVLVGILAPVILFLAVSSAAAGEDDAGMVMFPLTVHSLDNRAVAISGQVLDMLAQQFKTVCGSAVHIHRDTAGLDSPAAKQDAARSDGGAFMLWGSFTSIGKGFSLDLSLMDLNSGRIRRFFGQGDSDEKLAGVVKNISTEICLAVSGRKRVAQVVVAGNRRIEADAIKRVVTTRRGDIYDRNRVSRDIKNIYAMGYFDDVRAEAQDTPNGKKIVFTVRERSTVDEITVKDSALVFSQEDIKKELTVKHGAILNLADVFESVKRIEQMYKGKNYHNVKVSYKIKEKKEGLVDLEFIIDAGKKSLIRKIVFEGNSAYSDKQLRKVMKTSEKGFFSWLTSSGELEMAQLRQDMAKIAELYSDNGYIDARIAEPEIVYKDNWIYITIKISEGKRFKVGAVDIGGDVGDEKKELMQELKITGQNYFNRSVLRADILRLNDYYSDRGYFYADVVPDIRRDDDNTKVDITYVVKKGDPVYFDDIIITGNTKTRDKVIRRELDVYEQELYSGSRLKKSIAKLYRLNYFENVKVDTEEKPGNKDSIDLKINVEEKPTGMFTFGGGYSSVEDLFFTTSISQNNLFGRGQVLNLQAQVGGTSTEYKLSFTEPWLFDTHLSAGFDLYDWSVDEDTYDRDTTGGALRFSYPIYENTRIYFSYAIDDNRVKNLTVFAPSSIQEMAQDDGSWLTSSILTSLVYDTRDNVITPSRGIKSSLSVEYAGGPLGGDVGFVKYTGEAGWYHPLFWRLIGFAHSKFGFVHENGDGFLPDYERFYLGGINSLRGFDWHDIAVVKKALVWSSATNSWEEVILEEKGGDKFLQFNFEILCPMFDKKAGLVGVLFYDAGNVYDDGGTLFSAPLRKSAGFGIRWYSPMGPIRLERGYILNPREGEDSGGRWEFTMGTAF